MERKALLVGIDEYDAYNSLSGCVADARAMHALLATHADGSPNFDCRVLCSDPGSGGRITRALLRQQLAKLFTETRGEVLFYFAGHGMTTDTGAFLCTTDAAANDVGVSMDEVLQLAGRCGGANVIIILDCCHSGAAGNPGILDGGNGGSLAVLREGVTVMVASRDVETAAEADGHGKFTSALCDALSGGAADMMGFITAPAAYAYVERRFGPWDQRPMYKSHAAGVPLLRRGVPAMQRMELTRLADLFASADFLLQLDPAYEPHDSDGNTQGPIDHDKVEIARLLKSYRDAGLLRPSVEGEQLYHAARNSHTVELTARGREYWWLVRNGKI